MYEEHDPYIFIFYTRYVTSLDPLTFNVHGVFKKVHDSLDKLALRNLDVRKTKKCEPLDSNN